MANTEFGVKVRSSVILSRSKDQTDGVVRVAERITERVARKSSAAAGKGSGV
jgi:hypothetical protein